MSACAEWLNKLNAYADAELDPQEMAAFRAHAAQCPTCASAALASVEAKAAIRRAGRSYSAPSELRARVLSSLREQPVEIPKTQAKTSNLITWPQWAMAAAAALLLAAGLFFFASRYQRPNTLGEFADLHVANLASSNPVEVVSTDRHTVKPWFQGRIPFTFDLPDLQGSPFTLVGGRVTYFHQEPGAHLLFTNQKHEISAFIFRETPQLGIREASFADRGTSFNLQTWTEGGLRYVLVSDVNAATLQQLASLLQNKR